MHFVGRCRFFSAATRAVLPYAKAQRIESSRMAVLEGITVAEGIALIEGIAVDERWCW